MLASARACVLSQAATPAALQAPTKHRSHLFPEPAVTEHMVMLRRSADPVERHCLERCAVERAVCLTSRRRRIAEGQVNDDQVLKLLKRMLEASGKRVVPQGGVISPLLSNVYLNEVDKMLEQAKEVTRQGRYTYIEYARYADDLVILVDGYRRWRWLADAAYRRLLEALDKLDVQLNRDKTRRVDLDEQRVFRDSFGVI